MAAPRIMEVLYRNVCAGLAGIHPRRLEETDCRVELFRRMAVVQEIDRLQETNVVVLVEEMLPFLQSTVKVSETEQFDDSISFVVGPFSAERSHHAVVDGVGVVR